MEFCMKLQFRFFLPQIFFAPVEDNCPGHCSALTSSLWEDLPDVVGIKALLRIHKGQFREA